MVFLTAHTVSRSYLRHFHEYIKLTHKTSCSLAYQRSIVKYFTTDAAYLPSVSRLQVLRIRQSDFLSSFPLKSQINLWKSFSSRSAQVFSKDDSKTRQEKPLAFADSDRCLVFDAPGILISQLTFAESKALADNKKCRLVYMHKNSDGVPCFQLQAFQNVKASTASNVTAKGNVAVSSARQKQPKSSVKEFKIQATISDHDISVKLNQMKSLLVKGKQLKVHIFSSSGAKIAQGEAHGSGQTVTQSGKAASAFIKQFTEELGDVCKIKQDFANEKETCLNITPNETADKKEK
ncbi:hypothetical protein BsWGS_18079 [Bradybaena similaris]